MVVGPDSASSANSHHGRFSWVQNAIGIAWSTILFCFFFLIFSDWFHAIENLLQASWRQIILTFDAAAALMISNIFAWIASRWSKIVSVVGRTIEFWTAPIWEINRRTKLFAHSKRGKTKCIYSDNSWRSQFFLSGCEWKSTNFEIIFSTQIYRFSIQINCTTNEFIHVIIDSYFLNYLNKILLLTKLTHQTVQIINSSHRIGRQREYVHSEYLQRYWMTSLMIVCYYFLGVKIGDRSLLETATE